MKKLLRRVALALFVVNAIFVGAAIFARRFVPTHGDEGSDSFALLASMSGVEFTSSAEALKAAKATAFLGGVALDLRQAKLAEGARLELRAVLGGIAVAVPPEWRVEVAQRVFAGEVVNGTDPDAVGENAPLLIVDAAATMAGITIDTKGLPGVVDA